MKRRAGGADDESGEGAGALEIEFEDGDESLERAVPVGDRPRDLRAAALTVLGLVTLGAALSATHHAGSSNADDVKIPIVTVAAPDYAAYMVTVSYEGSHLASLQQRRIAVDLRITPVPGAQVKVLSYYVSENGMVSSAQPVLAGKPLPAAGADAELDLTVADCAVVPIGESMGFVNVVADGPAGITDRFTILGERYSADLARLLRTVCPARGAAGGAAVA